MDHSENISTMVRPSTPGSSLGSTPNLALSQDNYPSLSKSSSNNKRQRAESDDENQSFFKPDNFPKFLVIKSNTEQSITSLSPRSDSTTLPWSLGHTSHLGTILTVILVPIRECKE